MPTPQSAAAAAADAANAADARPSRVGRRTSASDADLARGLAANEGWAVTEMWHRFSPMVLWTAHRILGSMTDAEDIAQDTFCCVLEKIATLRAPDSLRGFIYGIANHALKAGLRRRRRQRSLVPLSFGAEEPVDGQSADVESRDIWRRFEALLSRLSPRHRRIFVLRRVEALTTEEVAAAAHVSMATVKRAVAYACRRLSCWIGADPELAALLDSARPRSRFGEVIIFNRRPAVTLSEASEADGDGGRVATAAARVAVR